VDIYNHSLQKQLSDVERFLSEKYRGLRKDPKLLLLLLLRIPELMIVTMVI